MNTVTVTNPNRNTSHKNPMIRIWSKYVGPRSKENVLVDEFEVPSRNPVEYCQRYAGGKYGQRYAAAISA